MGSIILVILSTAGGATTVPMSDLTACQHAINSFYSKTEHKELANAVCIDTIDGQHSQGATQGGANGPIYGEYDK